MATKVKLRQKEISGKRQSLYLDFYPPIPHPKTGELTRREFLGMYLFSSGNFAQTDHLFSVQTDHPKLMFFCM